MGLLERWDRRNQRLVDFQNDVYAGRFGIPQSAAVGILIAVLTVGGLISVKVSRAFGYSPAGVALACGGIIALIVVVTLRIRHRRRTWRAWRAAHPDEPRS
jgi:hypothetical protein